MKSLMCHPARTRVGLWNSGHQARCRRGTVMAMMAMILPVLAILAAFCINAAHMQLTRTELVVATDAAARAGGRALSEMQSASAAKTAAATTAAMNRVNGAPLLLQTNDGANEIEFGVNEQPDGRSGRYYFRKIPTRAIESGEALASAVQVHGKRSTSSLNGRVPLIIPGLLDQNDFATAQQSVAMQVDRDISLVLDRSGSMSWIDFNWPRGQSPWHPSTLRAGVNAGVLDFRAGNYSYASGSNSTTYQQWAWGQHFGLGPAPTPPWQDLVVAVNAFLDVLEDTSQEEQVSVASYASSASLDSWLEEDYSVVRSTVDRLRTGGNTAIGEGMQEGIETLIDSAARPHAAKTMVVMTDGIHNTGVGPKAVATHLVSSYNLTIHTVTFGRSADQRLMRQVAVIGGGNHYHAANGAELVAVFKEIANNLPTILTK